jgi:hypothetical protein
VQKESLEEHPDSDLRVYVVWFSMLAGDSRSGWDECVISDPRVTHLWGERRLSGRVFAGEVEDAAPPVWDAYLRYGPGDTWGDGPSRPISSGVYGLRRSGRAREEHTTALGVRIRRCR